MRRPSIPRGFRDFPPEIMILRKRVLSRIEDIFRRYGFDPIDTPAIEDFEVISGKYGEEAENKLMWRFQDPWSDRVYALRYDLTVPLARFIAMHRDTPMPFKRYHIAPVWRHEEPQRGRYREFYQCDADIVGSRYPEADAEILNLTSTVLEEFGLVDHTIWVNDRRILRGVFEEELGIADPAPIYRAIDKLDKIGVEGVRGELEKIGLSPSLVERIMDIIELRGEIVDVARKLRDRYPGNKQVAEGSSHLEEMASSLRTKRVVFSMSLVRGLDYYTGPIYEATVEKPRIGSIAGGGRYDNLIGMFTGNQIPATGISIGVERLIDAGLELGLFSIDRRTYTQAYIVNLARESPEAVEMVNDLAERLRRSGVNTAVDLMRRSPSKQREYARKLKIPILIYIGLREVEERKATIYIVEREERITIELDKAVETVKSILGTQPD